MMNRDAQDEKLLQSCKWIEGLTKRSFRKLLQQATGKMYRLDFNGSKKNQRQNKSIKEILIGFDAWLDMVSKREKRWLWVTNSERLWNGDSWMSM